MNYLTRKDVKAIRYTFLSTGLVVQIENKNGIEENVLFCYSLKRPDRSKLVVIKIGKFQKPILFHNTGEDSQNDPASLYFEMKHEKKMYQAVFEYLPALFRRSTPIISVSSESVAYFEYLTEVPGFVHTNLFEKTVDVQMLDIHFNKYPNQMSALIDSEITGQFSEDSPFLKVSTISSISSSPISLFQQFNGRELQLFNYKFNTNDIIAFLEKWILGVWYQNLELLYLYSPVSPKIDKRAIIRQFGLTRWPQNTPYMFEFESGLDRTEEEDKLVFDCRPYYQVERASDHKIAALEVERNSIKFFVFQ